jgi:hypothetical protein
VRRRGFLSVPSLTSHHGADGVLPVDDDSRPG